MRCTYGPLAVFSAGGPGVPDRVIDGATGGIFSAELNGPALPIYDFSDQPIGSITSSPTGQAQWRVDDQLAGWVRFDSVSVRVMSNDAGELLQATADAKAAAQQSATAAASASADADAAAADAAAALAQVTELINSGGGGGGAVTWDDVQLKPTSFIPSPHQHDAGAISDATTVGRAVMQAADAQAARAAIGAGTGSGTSNLQLGTSATAAAAGTHAHGATAITFNPAGGVTATNVQDAILQASQMGGGGSGVSAVYVWRYSAGGWPAMPATKPSGVYEVRALGPSYPTAIPGWVGLAATQVPLSYSKVAVA